MELLPLIGVTGLMAACFLIFCGTVMVGLILWLYVACLADVFRKSESEFRDRTLWIVILLISVPMMLMWLAAIVYYLLYKPSLRFWEETR